MLLHIDKCIKEWTCYSKREWLLIKAGYDRRIIITYKLVYKKKEYIYTEKIIIHHICNHNHNIL